MSNLWKPLADVKDEELFTNASFDAIKQWLTIGQKRTALEETSLMISNRIDGVNTELNNLRTSTYQSLRDNCSVVPENLRFVPPVPGSSGASTEEPAIVNRLSDPVVEPTVEPQQQQQNDLLSPEIPQQNEPSAAPIENKQEPAAVVAPEPPAAELPVAGPQQDAQQPQQDQPANP